MTLYRPLAQTGTARPHGAVTLAGGWTWFTHAARMDRHKAPRIVSVTDMPDAVLARLSHSRAGIAGLSTDVPRLMAILNTTPDSFSDGGQFDGPDAAAHAARRLIAAGADILDVGGESTRPGAVDVPSRMEIGRVLPAIRAARAEWRGAISIDTRKAEVARAALDAGATMVNDVSAMGYDAGMAPFVAESGAPVCLMHAQGAPDSMQDAPRYDAVVHDVYDFLAERVAFAEAQGIDRNRIVIDPGIGFGKTLQHNLTLIRNLSIFHGLGCPILLGASRKRFIGTVTDAPDAADRMPGSVAVALAGIAQGVQITRVHEMAATRQALTMWRAVNEESI